MRYFNLYLLYHTTSFFDLVSKQNIYWLQQNICCTLIEEKSQSECLIYYKVSHLKFMLFVEFLNLVTYMLKMISQEQFLNKYFEEHP